MAGPLLLTFSVHSAPAPSFPNPSTPEPAEIRALLVPRTEAKLSTEVAGRIVKLPVEEGERFRQGDLLIGFDCAIPNAELGKANAELAGAQHTVESNRKMRALGTFSQLELAVSEAKADEARAKVQLAKARVQMCEIRAPFNGRVVKRHVHAHEGVAAGAELLEILDDGALVVELFVPSLWLRWLKPGDPFQLQVGETGRGYSAKVRRIGARVDAVSQSIALQGEIEGEHPELLAGMSGTAEFTPPETP